MNYRDTECEKETKYIKNDKIIQLNKKDIKTGNKKAQQERIKVTEIERHAIKNTSREIRNNDKMLINDNTRSNQ